MSWWVQRMSHVVSSCFIFQRTAAVFVKIQFSVCVFVCVHPKAQWSWRCLHASQWIRSCVQNWGHVCRKTWTLWEEKRSTGNRDSSPVQSGKWMRGVSAEYWPAQTKVSPRRLLSIFASHLNENTLWAANMWKTRAAVGSRVCEKKNTGMEFWSDEKEGIKCFFSHSLLLLSFLQKYMLLFPFTSAIKQDDTACQASSG